MCIKQKNRNMNVLSFTTVISLLLGLHFGWWLVCTLINGSLRTWHSFCEFFFYFLEKFMCCYVCVCVCSFELGEGGHNKAIWQLFFFFFDFRDFI